MSDSIRTQTQHLAQKHCEACRADAPRLSEEALEALLEPIPDWTVVNLDKVLQLRRQFEFRDFVEALDFANRVAEIAEEEGHHPALLVEWGKVTVNWWTHKIAGLHTNDVIMAAKTDQLMQKRTKI